MIGAGGESRSSTRGGTARSPEYRRRPERGDHADLRDAQERGLRRRFSRELARPTGAAILHGARTNFGYGTGVREGAVFSAGSLEFEMFETPGHTIESISLVFRDRSVSDAPLMVFTGDDVIVCPT